MASTLIDGSRQIKSSSITNAQQNFGTPSASTDVAIKSYVDGLVQGLQVKPSAVVGTTATLPANTYANGTAGVGATLTASSIGILTVDGYNTVLNDYILVMNESAGANNGLYKVTIAGTAGVAYILTRAVEMDASTDFLGAFVFIERGTVNASAGYVCSNATAPTVGTTAITFQQFSGAGEITAGTGLSKSGNTLSIDTAITVDKTTVQTLSSKTLSAPTLTGTTVSASQTFSSFINEAKGTDIASATTTDIGGAIGNYVNVTGTVTITGLGTVQAGTRRIVNFTGILTLTYNATSLILPTTANITTAVGDTAQFISLGSGNWVCVSYQRASGTALATGASTFQRSTAVTGTQDGSNKVFTIANAVSTLSEQVFLNGQLLNSGSSNDYVISSTTVTFQAGFTAPASTDVIRVYGTY